jgi:hypothetical protein
MTAGVCKLAQLIVLRFWAGAATAKSEGRRPNVVLILTDNQGA